MRRLAATAITAGPYLEVEPGRDDRFATAHERPLAPGRCGGATFELRPRRPG